MGQQLHFLKPATLDHAVDCVHEHFLAKKPATAHGIISAFLYQLTNVYTSLIIANPIPQTCSLAHTIIDLAFEAAAINLYHSRAPPMPEVEHSTSASSLIDVDSPHVSSVPSDFESQSVKTDTQAERMEHEAEDKEREAEAKGKRAKEGAKKKAGIAGDRMRKNADNPVVLGNALVVGIGGATLGWFAYRKYTLGEFSWKVAGALAAGVGLFAAADVYVSQ